MCNRAYEHPKALQPTEVKHSRLIAKRPRGGDDSTRGSKVSQHIAMFRGPFGSRAVNNYLALLSCWLAEELRLVAVTKSLCYLGGEISKTQKYLFEVGLYLHPRANSRLKAAEPLGSVHPTGRGAR
jgi:hypothetical protein